MDTEIHIAYLAAGSAVFGSISGGLISFLTTYFMTDRKWKQDRHDAELSRRELLYSDFMAEAARILLSALDKKESEAKHFTKLASLFNQVLLIAPEEVANAARALFEASTNAHLKDEDSDSKSEEKKKKMSVGEFSTIARRDLDALRSKNI